MHKPSSTTELVWRCDAHIPYWCQGVYCYAEALHNNHTVPFDPHWHVCLEP